jgi:hypothetical protein
VVKIQFDNYWNDLQNLEYEPREGSICTVSLALLPQSGLWEAKHVIKGLQYYKHKTTTLNTMLAFNKNLSLPLP